MKKACRIGSYRQDPGQDIREEINGHLQMETERLMAEGMSEEEARAEARRLFGDAARHRRAAAREAGARERRARWADRFDTLRQDLRYAIRKMVRYPGFTVIAVLSLALGIGANTAVFSIVNTFLLGGLPMRDPQELVDIYTSDADGGYPYSVSSYPDLLDLRNRTDLFSGVVGYEAFLSRYETDESTDPVMGELVTHDIFRVLGLHPELGRFFVPDEGEAPGTHPVVVLGHTFWQSRLGGDPAIVGKSIRVGGTLFTVVGVAPKVIQSFIAPGFAVDMWAPYQMAGTLSMTGKGYDFHARGNRTAFIRARLRPGVTIDQVKAGLATMTAQHRTAYPESWKGRQFNVLRSTDVKIHPLVDGPLKGVAALLLTVVALVLLIACVNLAGFLLARASDRRSEIALRLALGARRWALVRQLLTETLLLGLLGGGAGLLVATWILRALVSFRPPIPAPLNLDFGLDGKVLAFTALISAAAGVFFGLIPALQSTTSDVAPTLKGESASGTGPRKRVTLKNTLIVVQVTLSTVLLLGAGLFVRSLSSARNLNIGFSARDGAVASVMVGMLGLDREQTELTIEKLEREALAIPGVNRVATAETLPLGIGLQTGAFQIPGVEPPQGKDHLSIRFNTVSGSYFNVMGIPLVAGRAFTDQDRADTEPVAIVSEAAARRYWPGESPLGKEIRRVGKDDPYRVVGVAGDTKTWTLGEEFQPYIYLARRQGSVLGTQLIARGSLPDVRIAGELRRMIRSVNPRLVIMEIKTIPQHLSVQLFPPRAAATLLGAFGLLALILATTGLYGTVAFSVSKRTREMGIRLSMGADAGQVVRMVLRSALGTVVTGAAVGVLLTLGLARPVARFLYGTSPADLVTFVGVPALLLTVALLAAWVPARRASRVDPVQALKTE